MARKCEGRAAHRLVVFDVDRADGRAGFAASRVGGPLRPTAGQRVLHHWQVVKIVAHVIQQPLHQARRDALAPPLHGLDDGLFALVAGEPWHQKAAGADGLGQAAEIGAAAQGVRAQRQHHAHGRFRVGRRLQQQLDEGFGLVRVGQALEAKDLFELIDHHQHPRPDRQACQPHHLHQPQATQPQLAVERGGAQRERVVGGGCLCIGLCLTVCVCIGACARIGQVGLRLPGQRCWQCAGQSQRQVGNWPLPRAQHRRDPSSGVVVSRVKACQLVQQPGQHQRRLAAARCPRHGHQRTARQSRHQGVDLLLTAKEAVGLAGLEGAQAGERIAGDQPGHCGRRVNAQHGRRNGAIGFHHGLGHVSPRRARPASRRRCRTTATRPR